MLPLFSKAGTLHRQNGAIGHGEEMRLRGESTIGRVQAEQGVFHHLACTRGFWEKSVPQKP
jgi:hypothetical protein